MRANYHTHTPRCGHADGSEREYIEQAILAGYTELGFSDHAPWRFDGIYRSRIRMAPDRLADYCAVLQALQKEYVDRIRIRIGKRSGGFFKSACRCRASGPALRFRRARGCAAPGQRG